MVGKLVMREESLEDLELYVDTLRNAVVHFWRIVGIAERETARKTVRRWRDSELRAMMMVTLR